MLRICAKCKTLLGCTCGGENFDCQGCDEQYTCQVKKMYYSILEEDRKKFESIFVMCQLCVKEIQMEIGASNRLLPVKQTIKVDCDYRP